MVSLDAVGGAVIHLGVGRSARLNPLDEGPRPSGSAQPGPGMLLGNLLCAVANLLNNTGATSGLTALLNHINTLLAGL